MKKNKSFIFSLLLLFFVQIIFAQEKIYLFQSDIEVKENGDLIVTENIKVRSEGYKIKRGIFRAIPNTYRTKKGFKFKIDYEVLEVLKDGRSENFHIKNQNGYSLIYLGNSKIILNPGDYNYTIKYKTNNQVGFYENFDELYWNVNGTEWDFTIDKIETTVRLPSEAVIGMNSAYTGKQGDTAKDFEAEKLGNNTIRFETTRKFSSNENLTIGVAWQKGIIHQPTSSEKISKFLNDNLFIVFGVFGTLLAFLMHLFNWKKVGEDPEKGTIIPLFKPHNDLSPSAMRYIYRMSSDNKSFTAALVSIATKGAIKIDKKNKIYHLRKEKNADLSLLTESEKSIVSALFKGSDIFKVSNAKHSTLQKAITNFKDKEEYIHQETYFKLNRKYLIGGIVLSVLTIVLMFVSIGFDLSLNSLFPALPVLGFIFIMFKNVPSMLKNIGGVIIGVIFISLFVFFPIVGSLDLSFIQIVSIVVVIVLLLFINFLFAYLMKAPTLFGRKEMDNIEGFKMYLKTAEEDRLDAMNFPNKTPELFEKYLPYAIALDCENQWAKKFESIIQDAIDSGNYVQPTWYIGRGHFYPRTFINDISPKFNNTLSTASMAPSQRGSGGGGFSGGSGGGGFSGGGGGGGGGGGW